MRNKIGEFTVAGQLAEDILHICNGDGRTLEEFFADGFGRYLAIEQGKAEGTLDRLLAEKNRHVQELVPS